jgi:dTDP-4-dehydrorhamnose reductase
MLPILIIGGTGMLGHKLVQRLSGQFEVWTTIRNSFDSVSAFGIYDRERTLESINVEDVTGLRRMIETVRPAAVINAVGVIKQLDSSKDVITTLTINSILPHRLHQLSSEFGFRLILISTDCVFNGEKGNYSEDDRPNATDLYGISKYLGEVAADSCLTIRSSIIGRELRSAHSLVEWFLSNRGKTVKGFVNAIYSGFPTIVFADIIADLLLKHPQLNGIYHISSEPIDKLRLLSLVNESFDAGVKIEPYQDFVIDRSLDSTRFREKTGFSPLPWEDMISQMAADPTPYEQWRR